MEHMFDVHFDRAVRNFKGFADFFVGLALRNELQDALFSFCKLGDAALFAEGLTRLRPDSSTQRELFGLLRLSECLQESVPAPDL